MIKASFDPSKVRLYQSLPTSHKGQNGKLLVIGGSKLFHSSIFWSADVASKIVDLVHLTSPANENNQIFRQKLKQKFWNGIVVDWKEVESYIEEDDAVLIGPGMTRSEGTTIEDRRLKIGVENRRLKIEKDDLSSIFNPLPPSSMLHHLPSFELSRWGKEDKTDKIVNFLLKKYPAKKWVIDGGALQEVDLELITESCILTPHRKEFERLTKKISFSENSENSDNQIASEDHPFSTESRRGREKTGKSENPTPRPSDYPTIRPSEFSECSELSKKLNNCTVLLKGQTDIVCQGEKCVEITGGNPGMTKGGTGDVLAGLAAALYTKNDAWIAATMASYINKKAGDSLYKRIGPYFNAADLVLEVPLTIYGIM